MYSGMSEAEKLTKANREKDKGNEVMYLQHSSLKNKCIDRSVNKYLAHFS